METIVEDGPGVEVDRLAHEVIGAAIEVHRALGPGFLEKLYEEALCVELELRGIPFQRQILIHLRYKGRDIGQDRLDLLVGDLLVVELKAIESLSPIHTAVAISYLKAVDKRLALLINFNVKVLKEGIKRVAL
jgi:GxxExxY protein